MKDEILPFLHGVIEGMETNCDDGAELPLSVHFDSTKDFANVLHLECQLRRQVQSHIDLCAKVDGIAEEVKRIKDRDRGLDEWLQLQDTAISDVRKLHSTFLDEHEAKFANLLLGVMEVRGLQQEQDNKWESGLQEVHLEVARLQAQSDARSEDFDCLRHEACDGLTGTRQSVADLVESTQQLEQRLANWRVEIMRELAEKFRCDESVRGDELSGQFLLLQREQDSQTGVLGRLQEAYADITEQMAEIRTLHLEMKEALTSEAAIASALDEQLWITDQRLGQRIDELAHSHCECMRVIERRLDNVLAKKTASAEISASPRPAGAQLPKDLSKVNADVKKETGQARRFFHAAGE
jgi:hypothetical protein